VGFVVDAGGEQQVVGLPVMPLPKRSAHRPSISIGLPFSWCRRPRNSPVS
jgi:hypothetical protein